MSSRIALLLITLLFSGTLIAITKDPAVMGVGTPEHIDFVNQFAGPPEQHVPFVQYQNFEPVSERSLILPYYQHSSARYQGDEGRRKGYEIQLNIPARSFWLIR